MRGRREQERPLPCWHLPGWRANEDANLAILSVAIIVVAALLRKQASVQRHATSRSDTSQVCRRGITCVCGCGLALLQQR